MDAAPTLRPGGSTRDGEGHRRTAAGIETMHPTSFAGLARLAPLPELEWRERLSRLQAEIAGREIEALLVFGSARDCAGLAYVSGFLPMIGYAIALIPAQGAPSLYLAMLGGDALKNLTWIEDVRRIDALADRLDGFRGRVALECATRMRSADRRRLAGIADDDGTVVETAMRRQGPRELELVRRASTLARASSEVAVDAVQEGASVTEALAAADEHARRNGARDVRVLHRVGGTTRPLHGVVGAEPAFGFYLEVEVDGYRGEALRTVGAETAAAEQRLDEAVASLGRGDLGAVLDVLEGDDPLIAGRPIAQLGLWPGGRTVDDEVGAGVYSLRTATPGALVSRTVEVGADQARPAA